MFSIRPHLIIAKHFIISELVFSRPHVRPHLTPHVRPHVRPHTLSNVECLVFSVERLPSIFSFLNCELLIVNCELKKHEVLHEVLGEVLGEVLHEVLKYLSD